MSKISVKVEAGALEAVRADVLVIGMFAKEKGVGKSLKAVDAAAKGALKRAIKSGDFSCKLLQSVMIYIGDATFKRLLLVGLGSRKKFSPEKFRRACGYAAREILKSKSRVVAVALPVGKDMPDTHALAGAAVEGAIMGSYRFTEYKSKKGDGADLKRIILRLESKTVSTAVHRSAERGKVVAESVNIARDLANTPALDLPPEGIAKKARSLARLPGFSCKVLGVPELKRLKMNAILAVGGGASRPPGVVEVK